MATTYTAANDPDTRKLYSDELSEEVVKATWFGKFVGESSDSLIQEKVETKKKEGDSVQFDLIKEIKNRGVVASEQLKGREVALTTLRDSIRIDDQRNAVKIEGRMTPQRVPWRYRNEAKTRQKNWWAVRQDQVMASHLACDALVTDPAYNGHHTPFAADPAHIIRAGNRSDDESLTSADIMTLDLISAAKVIARNMDERDPDCSPIRPIMINGREKYVLFLHDYQARQIKRNTAAGEWLDIQKAGFMGAKTDNPIYTGALGEYEDVIMHEWSRLPNGIRSDMSSYVADTKRAVLCGAQAAVIAYGTGYGGSRLDWAEESEDYGKYLGVASGCIWGMKATSFRAKPSDTPKLFGSLVISTYAKPPLS